MNFEQLQRQREPTGIAKGDVLLSYFGFVQPHKGFEQVLDVLRVLRSRGVRAKLVLVGELSRADPYHEQLMAR
jgi:glycosyltransferase involved in cell wall biosynthesis